MIFVSIYQGTFEFRSVDDAMKFVQTAAKKKDTIWVTTGDEFYPCLAVCTNEPYAAVNFFQNDMGDMWLSYNENNQKEVAFLADGVEWCPSANAVVSLNDAILCIREFLSTYEKPSCIQWQEL